MTSSSMGSQKYQQSKAVSSINTPFLCYSPLSMNYVRPMPKLYDDFKLTSLVSHSIANHVWRSKICRSCDQEGLTCGPSIWGADEYFRAKHSAFSFLSQREAQALNDNNATVRSAHKISIHSFQ